MSCWFVAYDLAYIPCKVTPNQKQVHTNIHNYARFLCRNLYSTFTYRATCYLSYYLLCSDIFSLPRAPQRSTHTGTEQHHTILRETLIYSVWGCCFTFFETVEDERVDSAFGSRPAGGAQFRFPAELPLLLQKKLAHRACVPDLAKRNNRAFPTCSLISASLACANKKHTLPEAQEPLLPPILAGALPANISYRCHLSQP